jgi:hypothetical protein
MSAYGHFLDKSLQRPRHMWEGDRRGVKLGQDLPAASPFAVNSSPAICYPSAWTSINERTAIDNTIRIHLLRNYNYNNNTPHGDRLGKDAGHMAAQLITPSHLQRALFTTLDPRSANHSLLPYTIWTSRIMYSAQVLASLTFWFKPACLFLAMAWLIYRAYQVLNKPLEELAALLGFDIPFTPTIELASVKADGVIIHWSLPEKQKHKSTLRYEIHVNGVVVDTVVALQESAVSITRLQPGSFYVVRVALVNSLDFSSKSAPVRFRTKQAESEDFYRNADEGPEGDLDGIQKLLPLIKPYRGLEGFTRASADVSAPSMARENSSGGLHKRSITGRRPSPVALGLETRYETTADALDLPEGAETIQQLTQKLDAIRHEIDETERLAKEDEEEELRQKEELIRERDQLRAEAAEKDKANRDLKRQIQSLTSYNTAAQNERNKHNGLLQQKLQEREKLKEDKIRWEREAVHLKEEAERIKQQKVELLEKVQTEKEDLLQRQVEETAKVKLLDDQIRDKAGEIKKLDRAAKNGSPNGVETENSLVQQLQKDAEEDRKSQMRRYELQHQYASLAQEVERMKNVHATQVRYLESVQSDRRRADEAAASAAREFPSPPPASERDIRRGDSQRSRHTNNDSPRMTTFPPVTSSPFGNGLTSTNYAPGPFLNIHNGMTISRPSEALDMSEEEKERMTGGAPMSPGAGAELIPADLFSNEDNRSAPEDVRPLAGLGALPGLGPINLPGLGAQPGQQEYNPGPASPTSPPSRAPSLFSSPQVSQNNLPTSPDNYMDSDRRSVHSTRSSRAVSSVNTGSRFSSMFGMKPRLKNSSMDESISGPALGKVQSQSMPRQDQGIPGLDSASRRRNSSISGPMFGDLLGKDGTADAEGGAENTPYEPTSQPRRRAFNLNPFNKDKGDGWPASFMTGRRPASPRPGSTHSSEFPRPSMDSGRWGSEAWPDSMGGTRASPLSLGGWNAPGQQSRIFGSRHPSRRPSVQHGASGPPEDIMEDEDSDALDADRRPHLAPIGTKPPPGSKQAEKSVDEPTVVDKLNPNSKDFKNFFSSIKLSSKDREKLREAEVSSSVMPSASAPTATHPPNFNITDDYSPPASRKSRDARSTTTIESSVAGSLRNSMDLARTPSYSNASETASNASPMLGCGSFGKESFMQKLQRKSSSGMWNLPTFKRDKLRLEVTAHEDDEEAMSASAGSIGRESREAQRGSRSWSNALKLGKKKGGEAPSVSGLSVASGADEEER